MFTIDYIFYSNCFFIFVDNGYSLAMEIQRTNKKNDLSPKEEKAKKQSFILEDNRPSQASQAKTIQMMNAPIQMNFVGERLTQVNDFKEKLAISGQCPIIEINNTDEVSSKVSDLPENRKHEIPSTLEEDTLEIIMISNSGVYEADTKAFDILDLSGGAAYSDLKNVTLISDKTSPEFLLHEMGHFKQNNEGQEGGLNARNSTIIILEYHNVIFHENLNRKYIRLCYNRDKALKKSTKTWTDLVQDFRLKSNDSLLLTAIDTKLLEPPYNSHIKDQTAFDHVLKENQFVNVKLLCTEGTETLGTAIKQFLINEFY